MSQALGRKVLLRYRTRWQGPLTAVADSSGSHGSVAGRQWLRSPPMLAPGVLERGVTDGPQLMYRSVPGCQHRTSGQAKAIEPF